MIHLSKDVLDFGTIKYGDTKSLWIGVKNTGLDEAYVEYRTSCGCTHTRDSDTLAVGESANLEVILTGNALGTLAKTLTVIHNGQYLKVPVKAFVQ